MDHNQLQGRKRSRSPDITLRQSGSDGSGTLISADADSGPKRNPIPSLAMDLGMTPDTELADEAVSGKGIEDVGYVGVAKRNRTMSSTPTATTSVETLKDDKPEPEAEVDENCADDILRPDESTASTFVSSEMFKIEIYNLPFPLKYPEARRLVLQKLDLKAKKVKLVELGSSSACIFATFENEAAKERALELAHGFEYRQQKLLARSAKSQVRPARRPTEQEKAEDRNCPVSEEEVDRMVANTIVPLQYMEYKDQLEWKKKEIVRVVASITGSIVKTNTDLKPSKLDGVLHYKIRLTVPPVLPSPVIDGYRNKNNFTIGRHPNGETMIGFRISSFRQGSVAVGSPLNVKTVPQLVLEGVEKMEHFITNIFKYEPYDPMTGQGLYRKLSIRLAGREQLMVILTISGGVLTENEIQEMGKKFTDYYSPPSDHGFASLFIHSTEMPGQLERNVPKLIFGEPKIVEEVLGMKFEISPDAFFQVNTACAEVLFEQIVTLAGIDKDTTVLDLCCGTGTLGIVAAKLGDAGEVIGIELCESAIEDAKTNVQNNFAPSLQDKFHYYPGRAETLIEAAINSAQSPKLVAIVDPPRCGLNSAVIAAIRRSPRIQKIVYVACKLEACKENFISFARPSSKKYRGGPFIPDKIIPIDMFPHTKDVECVVLLKRFGTNQHHT